MKNKRTPNNPEPVDYELCVMSKSEQIAETEKMVRMFEGVEHTMLSYRYLCIQDIAEEIEIMVDCFGEQERQDFGIEYLLAAKIYNGDLRTVRFKDDNELNKNDVDDGQ